MKQNNKILLVLILLVSFLSGCWNNKDIDKRVLPLVMGITKVNNDQYKVTAQIPITKKDGEISRIVTSIDDSVSGALGQIRTNSENAMDFTHIRLVIIQKDILKHQEDFLQLINFLMISKEISENSQLAFTNDSIEKIMSTINEKLGINSTSLYDYFQKGAGWAPEILSTRIWEVYRSFYSYTDDITVPVVESGKDTVLNYKGALALRKGKITQRINPNETQLIKLFQNSSIKGKIENVGFASVMVTSSTIKNKVSMKMSKPFVSTDIMLKLHVLERDKSGISNSRIEKGVEKLVEGRFNNMLDKAQENQTDIFGFGRYFRNELPYHDLKYWKERYYPDLKVKFQVHASIE